MNTVKIGDDFENRSYQVIEEVLRNKELSVIPEYCKIYRKKKYESNARSSGIVFDLSIEVTHPKSNKTNQLYLIECKKYSSKITVDEVAVFANYLGQIKNYSVRGIFITNNKLQKSALELIEHYGMMLIEVDEDNYNIIHYKNEKSNLQEVNDFDNIILRAISNALLPNKIEGLEKLSAKKINIIASNLINDFNPSILKNAEAVNLFDMLEYLKNKYDLDFKYSNIESSKNKNVLGFYNSEENVIFINSSIKGTMQEPFAIGHEIGHFILHKNLKANKTIYNNFTDISFNFFKQSYVNENPKNWIEWQANCFSSCLLLPEETLVIMLVVIQKELGISKTGTIYLDDQECNRKDFYEIIRRLSIHFGVSRISVEYRLDKLNLIVKSKKRSEENDDREILRNLSILRAKKLWD